MSLYLLYVGPGSVLGNLCMCLKCLSVGPFTFGAVPKCSKNLKSAKIVTGSAFSVKERIFNTVRPECLFT